ncbi:hypothetical protein [Hymenobacter metallicola]|uniref:Uncharacterized protein n=1 Tax=Hymenobacter metallicola TaxID=2563114 RepID=A0A4Z0QHT1_9BACT|nr:hypothetical protein [Hymenobacter metallicola]TGE28242.1 hypothetical protein E5K02_01900 [Hymenobacter metallicola]
MLTVQLANAGFYEISWPTQVEEGTTFIRPGARESVRVFVPRHSAEVEVYAGALKDGRLVYQGPADMAAQLTLLANRDN